MATVIGYLRVSTRGQGESGLGIESQRAALDSHAKQTGAEIAKVYIEVESGRLADRPELMKALAHARRARASLVVAKLDRLSRNAGFVCTILESGVSFTACDLPHANNMTLQIMAAVAEGEAKAISDRTKAALSAYKARGGKLGAELPQCRNLTQEARQKGADLAAEARTRKAAEAYTDIAPAIIERRANGQTLQQIADSLNAEGHTTRRGSPWNSVQVLRVLSRTESTTK